MKKQVSVSCIQNRIFTKEKILSAGSKQFPLLPQLKLISVLIKVIPDTAPSHGSWSCSLFLYLPLDLFALNIPTYPAVTLAKTVF